MGGKGNGDENDTEERNTARSFGSFSSQEETKKPWPPLLLFLGDVMMDPDPDQLYKQMNVNMMIICSLRLFFTILTAL